MNIEQLKQQLASGAITKEQYLAELTKLLEAQSISQEEHDAAASYEVDGGGSGGGMSEEDIEKMIQSATDKVRTDYAQKLKERDEELDRLKREKMTDEEKAKHDLEKAQNELAEQKANLLKREIALHANDELTRQGLPLSFRSFLSGATIEDTTKLIGDFQTEWNKAIKESVDAKFKENGSDPGKGAGGSSVKNPWLPGSINLTQQGKLLQENPALAAQFKAAAGVI